MFLQYSFVALTKIIYYVIRGTETSHVNCNFGSIVYLTRKKISYFHHISEVHKSADGTELTKAHGLNKVFPANYCSNLFLENNP